MSVASLNNKTLRMNLNSGGGTFSRLGVRKCTSVGGSQVHVSWGFASARQLGVRKCTSVGGAQVHVKKIWNFFFNKRFTLTMDPTQLCCLNSFKQNSKCKTGETGPAKKWEPRPMRPPVPPHLNLSKSLHCGRE